MQRAPGQREAGRRWRAGRAGKNEKRGREYTAPGRHAVLRGVRRAHRGSGTEATVGERRKKRKRKKAEYREKGSKKGGCGREQAREGGRLEGANERAGWKEGKDEKGDEGVRQKEDA